jgi:hypothetical protein
MLMLLNQIELSHLLFEIGMAENGYLAFDFASGFGPILAATIHQTRG